MPDCCRPKSVAHVTCPTATWRATQTALASPTWKAVETQNITLTNCLEWLNCKCAVEEALSNDTGGCTRELGRRRQHANSPLPDAIQVLHSGCDSCQMKPHHFSFFGDRS